MPKNSLLRDAIADAKAVRETALANAKAALEEAFTPHLTSMLSARLKNEAEGYDVDDEELEELNDPVSGDGVGSDEGGKTDAQRVEKSSFTGDQDVTTEDIDDTADNDSKLDSSNIAQEPTQDYGTSAPVEPATAASAATSSGDTDDEGLQQPAGTPVTEGHEDYDDEYMEGEEDHLYPDEEQGMEGGMDLHAQDNEYEMGDDELDQNLDLEAIIRELEADMDMGHDDEYGDEVVPENDYHGEEEYEDDDHMRMEQNDAEVSDGHGPGEGGAKDLAATQDSSFTQEKGDSQTDQISEGENDDDEEIDLEEILREIEAEDSDDEEEGYQAESVRLRSELKEYRDAVLYLRSKLNEVNLLNAKLLYTNRLFKSYNMDVRQKMRVVENFDRAATPREAKLVFATLAEAFQGKPVSRKRSRQSITEGSASRATGARTRKEGTGDSSQPTVLAEGVDLAARFKKLAGITKN